MPTVRSGASVSDAIGRVRGPDTIRSDMARSSPSSPGSAAAPSVKKFRLQYTIAGNRFSCGCAGGHGSSTVE